MLAFAIECWTDFLLNESSRLESVPNFPSPSSCHVGDKPEKSMKAVVYRNYGSPDVLICEEMEKPTAGDDEVLIKVRAASVNPLDWRLMRGRPYIFRILMGLRKPNTRPGHDVGGEVEAVGRNVTQFKPGDAVFGTCVGAFADYACASQSKLAIKPISVSFEQAASVPVAALTALQGLRDKGQI